MKTRRLLAQMFMWMDEWTYEVISGYGICDLAPPSSGRQPYSHEDRPRLCIYDVWISAAVSFVQGVHTKLFSRQGPTNKPGHLASCAESHSLAC